MMIRFGLSRVRRHAVAGFAAVAALGGATAATASDVAPPLRKDFNVLVHGTVPERCSLSQSATAVEFRNAQSNANTTRADTANLAFKIDCNTGFVVRMTSTKGALRNDSPSPGGMFATSMAYQARVELPGEIEGPNCLSGEMAAEGHRCARIVRSRTMPDGVLKGEGSIALTLVADGRPLLAGNYTDSLEITVTPLLGGADDGM